MTENEAINEIIKEVCSGCYGSDEEPHRCSTCGFKMAKDALEEIQQYRAIGTIEEFKALKEKSVAKKSDCIEKIPYGTKIIYHGQNSWKNCKCYCGHYNQEDGTYNIFRGWDLAHVPKADIEVFDWQ
jgi:hypothetical protein